MSAHFIGARTINDRRRRRLASGEIASPAVEPSRSRGESFSTSPTVVGPTEDPKRLLKRIGTLIPRAPWMLWGITLITAAGWLAVIWGGFLLDRYSPALREVFGLAAGHVSRYFTATMLVGVTQLSLIILWHRTRSRKDFHGRYRVWIWSCLVWPLFLIAVVTGSHENMSRAAGDAAPALELVFGDRLWVLPAATLFAATVRLLLTDMTNSPASRWLLRSAGLTGGLSLLTMLVPSLVPDAWRVVVQHGLTCGWPVLLAASFLHHARYVIHISNEAGPLRRRERRFARLIQESLEELKTFVPSGATAVRTMRVRAGVRHSRRLATWIGRQLFQATRRLISALFAFAGGRMSSLVKRKAKASRPARNRPVRATKATPVAEVQQAEALSNPSIMSVATTSELSSQDKRPTSKEPRRAERPALELTQAASKNRRKDRRLDRTVR